LGPAAGDQIMASLGVWEHGVIPGIPTIDHIADDVHHDHLNILQRHLDVGSPTALRGAVINSKGFGGNNASAVLLSPEQTLSMMSRRHGNGAVTQYRHRNEPVLKKARDYDAKAVREGVPIIYQFGESVMDADDVTMTADSLKLATFEHAVSLRGDHPYDDMV
ncbi:MAG: beta-ketoacyl synthase, partial [Natronospirillum sp.]